MTAGARGTWPHLFVMYAARRAGNLFLVLCSSFSFCKDQGLSPGNGTTHSGRVFSSVDLIGATPHSYAQGAISQVILAFIKQRKEVHHYGM